VSEGDRHRFLVIEDDPGLREVYAEALTAAGNEVRNAPEGGGALRILQSGWMPCVILLDLRMPGLDGWQFARRIRDEPAWRDIPIVVVAAHVRIDREAREINAVAWLQKPFDLTRLERVAELASVEQHEQVAGNGGQH